MSAENRTGLRFGRAVAGVAIAATVFAVCTQAGANAVPAGSGVTPTVINQSSPILAPVVTEPITAAKAAARARAARTAVPRVAATSKALAIEYLVQPANSSWCGPATLADIADYRGMGWSGTSLNKESSAASLLGVTEYGPGTPWTGPDNVPIFPFTSSHPMEDALNYLSYKKWGHTWYSSVGLPNSPSSADVSAYMNNLVFDVDTTYDSKAGFPIASNEYAAPGYQLQKQPGNMYIFHWFAASGYYSSGAGTYFSDPGWGGGTRSQDSSSRVVTALGGRGYVW